jgi:D-alanyl-lipoteichoic acid acyltransferase DltB (MBOAT superfamily)
MLFPTTEFAIFFLVVFLGHWLLQPFRTPWRLFMLAASLFFYGWWNWHFVFLLLAVTAISQAGAQVVYRARSNRGKRWVLLLTLVAMLGLLGWFKYYGFFALNVTNALGSLGVHASLPLVQVALPVGISFFTFMAISYVVDVYRKEIKPAAWLDYAVYLSFFPHLVAGPIVRGSELLPQVRTRRDPRRIDLARAAYLIVSGLFKKVVISSYVATQIVDPVFANPNQFHTLSILFAIYGYAVQIYADFSGYTDIAIGIALLLGFEFPQNFDRPYTARTVQDFWRRWHMTLSRWLRDYLYIPLGGSRGTELQTYRNLFITMLLGGLWHGAAWTFVAWGALHGAGLAVGRYRAKMRVARGEPVLPDGVWDRFRQRVATFHFVCLGWVFFRSDSFATAWKMLLRLFSWGPADLVTPLLVAVVLGAILVQYVPKGLGLGVQRVFGRMAPAVQAVALGACLFAITVLGPQGVAPFIYFQF